LKEKESKLLRVVELEKKNTISPQNNNLKEEVNDNFPSNSSLSLPSSIGEFSATAFFDSIPSATTISLSQSSPPPSASSDTFSSFPASLSSPLFPDNPLPQISFPDSYSLSKDLLLNEKDKEDEIKRNRAIENTSKIRNIYQRKTFRPKQKSQSTINYTSSNFKKINNINNVSFLSNNSININASVERKASLRALERQKQIGVENKQHSL
jgi:hypothetical protein